MTMLQVQLLTIDSANNATFSGIIESTELNFTNGGTIHSKTDTNSVAIAGGTNSNVGANIAFYGGNHASLANLVRFRANSSETMRITSSGNVGIGTSSPQEKLQINSADSSFLQLTNNSTGTADNNGLYVGVISGGNSYIGNRHSGDDIIFQNDNTEVMRIKTGGNVGIGTSSPSGNLHVEGGEIFFKNNSGNSKVDISASDSGNSFINFGDTSDGDVGRILYEHANNVLQFKVNASEAMRIANDQSLFINTTGISTFTSRVVIFQDNTKNCAIHLRTNATASQSQIIFGNGNSDGVGSIATSGTSTAYNTTSDYRLKENVSYDFDATTRLKQLKPARFNFIADADTTVDGFLAHEVSSVVPEAITGTKDAVDEDGNPKYQGIDQSKLVPLLVKTIQELEARITQLENA
jgi:hypothetical protein